MSPPSLKEELLGVGVNNGSFPRTPTSVTTDSPAVLRTMSAIFAEPSSSVCSAGFNCKVWGERLFEFARAVIPLAVFIIVYCGIFVHKWFITTKIVFGLVCVIIGLTFFKYGLTTGLMPFAERIGDALPSRQSDLGMVLTTGLLGTVVTFAEPGIDSLQMVGKYVDDPPAMLTYLLIQKPFVLLCSIAAGVGVASAVGMLRIRRAWRFVPLLLASVPLSILITQGSAASQLHSIVALAWDSGAITTGPATVPIVLALGSGLAKSCGNEGASGFGVVTLASLFPILSVLVFGIFILLSGVLDEASTEKIIRQDDAESGHDPNRPFMDIIVAEAKLAAHSIIPLASYLLLVQLVVIRRKIKDPVGYFKGVFVAFFGLSIFNVGLYYGSLALGDAAGKALPSALTDYPGTGGMAVILVFGCVCGLIATFIDLEPCGLGELAHEATKGRIRKLPLFFSISVGVGIGVSVGFARVIYFWNLVYILIPGYVAAIILSLLNRDETLVCIAWDAAGVTTGPVTVPLVLSLGVGIADVTGGAAFGILACASVFPIMSVLCLGLMKMPPRSFNDTILMQVLGRSKR